MRRLRCWLLGHRGLVWNRYPVVDQDAEEFLLRCRGCHRTLERFSITHTILVTRWDAEEFTRKELWDRMRPHLRGLFQWPPAT